MEKAGALGHGLLSMNAPVIVIGAHRSGTSMAIRMLERLGLFCGKRKDTNHEALFFVRFNEWLLRRAGASWGHPEPVRELFTRDHASDARAVIEACAENIIRSPHAASFLGWRRYARYRGLTRLRFPWGWKDPRNTFTLPLWFNCFPQAKVVHVMRHGVDVAQSLTARHLATLVTERARVPSVRLRYLLTPYRDRFFDTIDCGSIEGSFAIWERYVSEARRQLQLASGRAFELRYEDLVADPLSCLSALADFCEMDASPRALSSAAAQARSSRAYAYRHSPELQDFAHRVTDRLALYGYAAT